MRAGQAGAASQTYCWSYRDMCFVSRLKHHQVHSALVLFLSLIFKSGSFFALFKNYLFWN